MVLVLAEQLWSLFMQNYVNLREHTANYSLL